MNATDTKPLDICKTQFLPGPDGVLIPYRRRRASLIISKANPRDVRAAPSFREYRETLAETHRYTTGWVLEPVK